MLASSASLFWSPLATDDPTFSGSELPAGDAHGRERVSRALTGPILSLFLCGIGFAVLSQTQHVKRDALAAVDTVHGLYKVENISDAVEEYASDGCMKCCQHGDCSAAFKGRWMGTCCSHNPIMCCPYFAKCVPGRCQRTGPYPIGMGRGSTAHRASPGCLDCCQNGNCTVAFKGVDMGSCCHGGGQPTCCPYYAKCATNGCIRTGSPTQRPLAVHGNVDEASAILAKTTSTSSTVQTTTTVMTDLAAGGDLIPLDR